MGASEPPAPGQVGRGKSACWWRRAVGVYSMARGRGRFGDFIHVHERPIVFGTVRCWVGGFRGLIPKVRWCRSRERGGTCPRSLARQKDLGKGVWSVGLGCRRASSFYFSARSVDSRARLEAHWAAVSPGAWGLRQSKPRLSRGFPALDSGSSSRPPTVGLSGLRHPAQGARVAQVPSPLSAACALRAWADSSSPLEEKGPLRAQTRGGTSASTSGGPFRSMCAQPCAPGSRGREAQTRLVVSSVPWRRTHLARRESACPL